MCARERPEVPPGSVPNTPAPQLPGAHTHPPRRRRAAGHAALPAKPPSSPTPARAPHSRPRGGAPGGSGSHTPRAGRAPAARGRPATRPPAPGRSRLTRHGMAQVPHMAAERPAGGPAPLRLRARPATSPGRSASRVAPPRAPRARESAPPPGPPRPLSPLPGSLGAPAGAPPVGPGDGTQGEARPGSAREGGVGGGGRGALGRRSPARGRGWGGGGGGQALLHKLAFPVRRRFRGRLAGGVQVRTPGAGSLSFGHWWHAPWEAAGRPPRPSVRPSLGRSLGPCGEDPAPLSSRVVAAPGGSPRAPDSCTK